MSDLLKKCCLVDHSLTCSDFFYQILTSGNLYTLDVIKRIFEIYRKVPRSTGTSRDLPERPEKLWSDLWDAGCCKHYNHCPVFAWTAYRLIIVLYLWNARDHINRYFFPFIYFTVFAGLKPTFLFSLQGIWSIYILVHVSVSVCLFVYLEHLFLYVTQYYNTSHWCCIYQWISFFL